MTTFPKQGSFFVGALLILVSKLAFANTLLTFDNSHLVALKSSKGLVGYFNIEHQVLNFSCSFLFKETNRQTDSMVAINSFPIDLKGFTNRNKDDDIPGRIYISKGEWIVQTDEPHAGCGGAVGSFKEGPNDEYPTRYSIVRQIPAIGIRLVLNKTGLRNKNGNNITERKGYLIKGDVVAAIEIEGELTRIRYVHPATGKVTIAWVESSDLIDPFAEVALSK